MSHPVAHVTAILGSLADARTTCRACFLTVLEIRVFLLPTSQPQPRIPQKKTRWGGSGNDGPMSLHFHLFCPQEFFLCVKFLLLTLLFALLCELHTRLFSSTRCELFEDRIFFFFPCCVSDLPATNCPPPSPHRVSGTCGRGLEWERWK